MLNCIKLLKKFEYFYDEVLEKSDVNFSKYVMPNNKNTDGYPNVFTIDIDSRCIVMRYYDSENLNEYQLSYTPWNNLISLNLWDDDSRNDMHFSVNYDISEEELFQHSTTDKGFFTMESLTLYKEFMNKIYKKFNLVPCKREK